MQEDQEQANVQVQRSGEPVVRMQQSEQEPNIRYTAEEAQVRVNRAEGEPEIRFEQNKQQAENRNKQAENRQAQNESEEVDRQNTAAIPQGGSRDDANTAVAAGSSSEVSLTVADIRDYDIVGADGNDLGDIEEVVNVNNRLYAVVTSGGFLGLGENRAAVPLSALHVTDQETLQAPNVTERKIDGMANFDSDRYEALPDEHPITLGAR
ncbi:ribosomal 30S subunit maturation factor RimM [Pseudorhizobium tarimense]|uniref:Ribosomal 30S subunit maturation factor RimM n=1 Tax=Pseudorhizobium tarimense TaxID=1079109 RepID=A0ABV2HE17_9HYPH|nr:PRC-barrel domain-containing protein [Pseudorhizobium tarimense]MCJ8520992.1 PRC-barrel domain-containing protein [Pseudorhizobium tarimense]MCJ8521027.1 PRC-barrel domain-containing protein [Pseudorhizobium tarimense]